MSENLKKNLGIEPECLITGDKLDQYQFRELKQEVATKVMSY